MAIFGLANLSATSMKSNNFECDVILATMKLYGFDIHESFPTVMHRSVPLESSQRVYSRKRTHCRDLQIQQYYAWNQSTKIFCRQKRGARHSSMFDIFFMTHLDNYTLFIQITVNATINIAQDQLLNIVWLNLTNPCSSHGYFYVACSRLGKPKTFIHEIRKPKILFIHLYYARC